MYVALVHPAQVQCVRSYVIAYRCAFIVVGEGLWNQGSMAGSGSLSEPDTCHYQLCGTGATWVLGVRVRMGGR